MTTYLDGLADPEVLPRVDDVNRGHFEAAAKGRLAVRQCTACDLLFHYPRPFCPRCHSAQLRWTDLSGEATVVVSAVVSRPPWNDLPRSAPYPVVIVRLAEGQGKPLEALTLKEMQDVEPRITKDIFAVLGVQNSVKSRVSYGGTAPANVKKQVARWRKRLAGEKRHAR